MSSRSPVPVVVVPLYNPDPATVRRLDAMQRQAPVIAVDDGSTSAVALEVLEQLAVAGINVVRHGNNRGIASALNSGFEFAIAEFGATHVACFDQDSDPGADYVDRAITVLEEGPSLGLAYPEFLGGNRQIGRGQGDQWRANEPMQSGWVLAAESWRRVGRFREDLVIDCVDTDFYLRFLALGGVPLPMWGENVPHELGESRRWLFLHHHVHSPQRHYYIARNRVRLAREFGRTHPRVILRGSFNAAVELAKTLLAGPLRRGVLVAVTRGLIDGARQVTGVRTMDSASGRPRSGPA